MSLMVPVVDGEHLQRILGDSYVFVVDAHHPPRMAQFVVYERRASMVGATYHGLQKLFMVEF